MGLFDFAKNVGKTIGASMDFGKELSDLGLKVEDAKIDFKDGVVEISGKVKTQEEREKVVLALGNVDGVRQVIDSLEVESDDAEAEFYTVKPGDSLSKIAKSYYGNAMKYTEIFEANKPMLTDPNKIYPGQVLRIPKL